MMKYNWRSLFLVAGLGLGAVTVAPACVVKGSVRPAYVVTRQPPAPRYVTPRAKPGHVWIKGRWQWNQQQWVWKSGQHVRARAGRSYVNGRWEQRGNRWHWVDGRWVSGGGRDHRAPRVDVRDHRRPAVAPPARRVDVRDHRRPAPVVRAYPVAAPPAPRYQTQRPRRGFVWIKGHFEWNNGAYAWTSGRWEAARASKVWVPGTWTAAQGRWVWTAGYWQDAPRPVDVRDHRNTGRRNEVVPARRGRPR